MQWIKGWQREKPKSVRFDTDTDGHRRLGCRPDCRLLAATTSQRQAHHCRARLKGSLFAVAAPSDLARLSRDKIERLAHGIRYRYIGTKELRAVPKFTKQHGLGLAMQELVCPARALEAYIDRTADPSIYFHSDPAYDFEHVFMSQTPAKYGPYKGMHDPVGPHTCSRWMREVMTRGNIACTCGGGSVRMAAASAAIDSGVAIDVVLSTGRWSSWTVFHKFYSGLLFLWSAVLRWPDQAFKPQCGVQVLKP